MINWDDSSEITLVQRRGKLIFALVVLCIFGAILVWMALNPETLTSDSSSTTRRGRQGDAIINLLGDNAKYFFWFLAANMFGVGVYAFGQILKPSRLVLNDKGLLISKFYKEEFFNWSQVSPFLYKKTRVNGAKSEQILSVADVDGQEKKIRMPVGFGMKIAEQADLLNEYRNRGLNPSLESDEAPEKTAEKPIPTMASAVSSNDWQPPKSDYDIREERAPWGRRILALLLIAAIIFGAIWLVRQTIVPDPGNNPGRIDLPVAEKTDEPVQTRTADDEAWVRALEKDTLEGYREYLAEFPEGNHKDEAQAQIDAYDNKAWATAEQRDTIAGYEDYLEAWPEGLHASKARERIAEMKAAAEARRKDAAERARQDTADWERAAQSNTVPAYQGYMSKHPAGKHVSEAQSRIDRLQATAADNAAWQVAKAANRADSYQQYLTSFPQGAYVAQAIAALEQLKPAVGRAFKDCNECPQMVSLPTGTATLGAADGEAGARPNEGPARPVTISDMFAMSVTEVTFAEWGACVTAGACKSRSDNGWGRGTRPVINVSWTDAQAYVTWLSSKTGFSYALPSEAQWEYAARAGQSGPYIGGSEAAICAFANGAAKESGLSWANNACTDPAADRTLPAGTLPANKFGLRDMIGNVAEWTQDCNTLNLRDAPTDGKADQRGSCNQRVARGGSWFSGPSDVRFASRLMQRRGDSNDFTGLRVVRKIPN